LYEALAHEFFDEAFFWVRPFFGDVFVCHVFQSLYVFVCGSAHEGPHPNGQDCPPAISQPNTMRQNKPFQRNKRSDGSSLVMGGAEWSQFFYLLFSIFALGL
jgi:hypothetical protein